MKIYYIKDGKCVDLTKPVLVTCGVATIAIIGVVTPLVLTTGASALVPYTYEEYCREVYKALQLNLKHFIPLRL